MSGGRGAVCGRSNAVLVTLLLDSGDADVVRTIVVTSQHVAVLLTQARPVVRLAAVELALNGGLAGFENAVFLVSWENAANGKKITSEPDSWRRLKSWNHRWRWQTERPQQQQRLRW